MKLRAANRVELAFESEGGQRSGGKFTKGTRSEHLLGGRLLRSDGNSTIPTTVSMSEMGKRWTESSLLPRRKICMQPEA